LLKLVGRRRYAPQPAILNQRQANLGVSGPADNPASSHALVRNPQKVGRAMRRQRATDVLGYVGALILSALIAHKHLSQGPELRPA